MGFNKGEWSELYTFLYLLENPNLVIVDENLQIIDNTIFKILEIISTDKKYKIEANNIVKLFENKEKNYSINYLSEQNKTLLSKILAHKSAKGSFEINEIQALIDDFFDGRKPKAASNIKADLIANVLDTKRVQNFNISYSIKSSLGNPATLLNASKLDEILASMLLLSYEYNQKDIKKLISIISKNEDENIFYKKKIGDFANAVTFGMRAGEIWDGTNEINGGVIFVTKIGEVYLLDLIYFKNIVDKYLIDNIKFDSPSSSRYKMFDIYKENGRYFFKLNLQIRFK